MDRNLSAEEAEWLRIWEQLGQRINQFPEWIRTILLDDMDTAIRNRIAIFEMIQKKVAGA